MRIQPALFTAVIASGAVAWAVGNLFWLSGRPVPNVVLWWLGFLVLTIAGERLELSRLLRLSRSVRALFLVIVLVMVAGMALATFDFAVGVRVTGFAWLLLAGWLLRFDIARRRVRAGGQARFVALALLAGYGWLAVGGYLALTHNGTMAGPRYDALLHGVAVGFVFSMIFAHAPIIVPAVLRVDFRYHPRLYAPLALLHLSLALRILGDLLLWWPARLWGGLLGALAILFYLVLVVTAVRRPPCDCRAVRCDPLMPFISRLFIRTSLAYLIAALVVGLLLALGPIQLLPMAIAVLNPVYFHLFMVGWVTQLIVGVAYWMFPKFSRTQPRGSATLAGITYFCLNLGLLLRAVAEPTLALNPTGDWGWVLALAALLQWLGGVTFVVNTWPWVKNDELGKRTLMPRATVWFLRAALIYLLLGFTLGALLLWNKGLPISSQLWRLLPAHIEFLLVGWTLLLVQGVAFWIAPRFHGTRPRVGLVWTALILVNLGVWIVAVAPFLPSVSGLTLGGRLAEVLAVVAFALHLWPRIKPAGA